MLWLLEKSKVTPIFKNKINVVKKKVQSSGNNPTNIFFTSKALLTQQFILVVTFSSISEVIYTTSLSMTTIFQ